MIPNVEETKVEITRPESQNYEKSKQEKHTCLLCTGENEWNLSEEQILLNNYCFLGDKAAVWLQ